MREIIFLMIDGWNDLKQSIEETLVEVLVGINVSLDGGKICSTW